MSKKLNSLVYIPCHLLIYMNMYYAYTHMHSVYNIHTSTLVCIYIYVYLWVYVCMIYIHICVHISVHIHTQLCIYIVSIYMYNIPWFSPRSLVMRKETRSLVRLAKQIFYSVFFPYPRSNNDFIAFD